MGFGNVATFAILATVLIIGFSSLYGVTTQHITNINDASDVPTEHQRDIENTDFEITSASESSGTITIDVKNTGQTTIEKEELTLLIDGTFQDPSNYSMTPTIIQPTETGTITIDVSGTRVYLVHDTGLKDGSDVA